MARLVRLETDLGNIRPHTARVFEEFARQFEIHFAWGIGASGDHKAGKALDLMAYSRGGGPSNPGAIRPGWNKTVAEYARKNWKRLGIDYIIYDQLIMSNNPGGYAYGGASLTEWQDYTGESHANHVHISFEENPPAYRPPTTQEEADVALTTAEIDRIATRVLEIKKIPNKNDPNGETVGMGNIAGHLSNVEATQDAMYRNQRAMLAQVAALGGTVAELAKALAAHGEGVDADALVIAVRGAAEAGAIAALQGTVDVRVTVDTDQGNPA